MKPIYGIGVRMISLMIFVCPIILGQDKAAAEAKRLAVSITLKSGEVVTGLLVKIDNESVEFKVNDAVQNKPMREVSQIRFNETTTSTAITESIKSLIDPPIHSAAPDPVTAKPVNEKTFELIKPVIDPPIPAAAPDPATAKPVDEKTPDPSSLNRRPTIVYKEKARYTDEARNNEVEGIVVLNVLFTEDGTISSIQVVRGLPDGLTETAIEAAKRIKFTPAIKNGQPISFRGDLEYSFYLNLILPPPKLLSPPHKEVVTTDLRKTTLHWAPVPRAASYRIRLEKESKRPGKWTLDHETEVTNPYYDFDFTGAERWRWRVQAVNEFEREGHWSDWSIVGFTK